MKPGLMTLRTFFFLAATACLLSSVCAQTLTVREIMAEPSIAGMRVEGEKLSPDGTKVVYLWNAQGKLPRDLYLVSTTGGDATKILSPSDLPPPSRPPEKENKLDYGLTVRDEFVKERENQLGNFEWSPDSKRLVTSYGGDLYVLTIGEKQARRLTRTQSPETGARFPRQRSHPLFTVRESVRTRSIQFPSDSGFERSERRFFHLDLQHDAEQTRDLDRVCRFG
jgi:hypothetical protein